MTCLISDHIYYINPASDEVVNYPDKNNLAKKGFILNYNPSFHQITVEEAEGLGHIASIDMNGDQW